MFKTQEALRAEVAARRQDNVRPLAEAALTAAMALIALWATLSTIHPAHAANVGAAGADQTFSASFYLPAPADGPITNAEQRLLTGLNIERLNAGLAPLAFDPDAALVARIRVRQMVDQNYFGHVDPDGNTMYVELLGIEGVSYQVAGENLAINNYAVSESPERAVAALMRSPSHRDNVLYDGFDRIGVGELTAPDGRHFYAMIFLG